MSTKRQAKQHQKKPLANLAPKALGRKDIAKTDAVRGGWTKGGGASVGAR
jgi:hypothetical protein